MSQKLVRRSDGACSLGVAQFVMSHAVAWHMAVVQWLRTRRVTRAPTLEREVTERERETGQSGNMWQPCLFVDVFFR